MFVIICNQHIRVVLFLFKSLDCQEFNITFTNVLKAQYLRIEIEEKKNITFDSNIKYYIVIKIPKIANHLFFKFLRVSSGVSS